MTRFLFVGNRRFVLERMLEHGLSIEKVLVIENSHLDRDASALSVDVDIVRSLADVLRHIEATDFDVLVSNGCPYILPISQLAADRQYVNIHPSFLPDLRGIDPVVGAVLHGRDCGATCHVIDSGIDTGAIISRILIPFSPDLDVSLLYQLSFAAEQDAFSIALDRNFDFDHPQETKSGLINYKRSAEDRTLFFTEPVELIVRKVKAFSNRSQGCFFSIGKSVFRTFDATIVRNSFLDRLCDRHGEREIVLAFEGAVIVRYQGNALKLASLEGDLSRATVGMRIDTPESPIHAT